MTTMTGDPTRVRLADARDEDELMELCRSLHSENAMFGMSEVKVRSMLQSALTPNIEERRGLIGVVGDRGKMEGSVYLEISAPWYSDQFVLGELWSYVYPRFRASNNSQDLIAFAKLMADHFSMPLMIGVLSNIRTAAKIRLYRKQLGEPVGAFFVHGSVGGQSACAARN